MSIVRKYNKNKPQNNGAQTDAHLNGKELIGAEFTEEAPPSVSDRVMSTDDADVADGTVAVADVSEEYSSIEQINAAINGNQPAPVPAPLTTQVIGPEQPSADNATKKAQKEKIRVWLDAQKWSTPKWLLEPDSKARLKNYKYFIIKELRTSYVLLEDDFRSYFNNYFNNQKEPLDPVIAGIVIEKLMATKMMLEMAEPNVDAARNYLNMVDQYMTWLYPQKILVERGYAFAAKLKEAKNPLGLNLEMRLKALEPAQKWQSIRAAIEEAKQLVHKAEREMHDTNTMQSSKLVNLTRWSGIFLGILLVFLPTLIRYQPLRTIMQVAQDGTQTSEQVPGHWAETFISYINPPLLQPWFLTLVIALAGGAAGFFSGLLQLRSTKLKLSEYEEAMLNFLLRPSVGAISALIVFTFLSWDVLAGVKIENAGTFFLIAFLSGFSESYFLKLLRVDDESIRSGVLQNGSVTINSTPNSTTTTEEPAEEPITETPPTSVVIEADDSATPPAPPANVDEIPRTTIPR